MGKEEEDIKLIEQYLEDSLESEEKTAFEQRLIDDAEFNILYKDVSKLIEGIEAAGNADIATYLRELEDSLPEVKPDHTEKMIPIWGKNKFLGVAASIAVLIAASVLFYTSYNGAPDNQVLFTQYFEVYPNQILPTKRGEYQPESDKEKAYYAYDLGQFKEAINLLRLLPQDEDGGAALFYTGMAALAINDTKTAIKSFNEYLGRHAVFVDTARWFLALSYLKDDQINQASNILKEVVGKENSYSGRAKELLRELE